ncbi:TIGR01777 family protein [Glaciihabitans arcticus]|uniref:TIGR01777 family protein n=1 Tax=Glaciihabitans arcticus TaxID=2668039 RepID=A0A4Q9GTM4_9MICO|nr:TIGR01777 family oxidoreductase [Glaciihabitans arcticus]TBN56978.1 TIGR01777 family protein [Glaciihabitans arcticus]
MTGQRIVIAGASGFMGQYFVRRFREEGETVVTVGRSGSDVTWGDTAALEAALDGADLLLNLAGKSVNARYSGKTMAAIFSSRLLTTGELGRAVEAVASPPKVWLNSSTATIYKHSDERPNTDEDGIIGEGFSVNVANAWEGEFFAHARDETRQVALRMAIVLGDGSALAPLLALTRLGFGGTQFGGKTRGGRQMFSWVHIEDVYRAIRFLQRDVTIDGTVNISSPNPVRNRELMATLRRVLGVPFGIPLFRWMLELGAFAIRTETELLLKSRWVLPTRLLAEGFEFEHPELEGAVRDITGRA